MPTATVRDQKGSEVGDVELNDSIFAAKINTGLMHDAIVTYLNNQRVGSRSTKQRGEVRGGGRKPWRQKGTGRARHGTIRSPLWRGGAITFGARPRDFSQKMTKQARRAALRSALTAKFEANELFIIDTLEIERPKTREIVGLLTALGLEGKTLVVTAERDRNVELAAANLPEASTILARELNVYQVLNHANVVLAKDALDQIEEVLA